MADWVPPHNLEAEQCVLGSMLIEPAAVVAVQGLGLTPTDYYRPAHQLIHSAVVDLCDRGREIDLVTITAEIKRRRQLQQIGGAEYLMAVMECVPTAANVEHYARIVLEHSLLRQADVVSVQAHEMVRSGAEPRDVIKFVNAEMDRLQIRRGSGIERIGAALLAHYQWLSESTDKIGLDGYTTGFSRMDVVTGGYGQPMYVVLKARRGAGKTHHLVQTSINCIRAGYAAVVCSMDSPRWLILNRYLAHLTGINSRRIRRPRSEDWTPISDASAWLHSQPLYIWEQAGITVSDIRAICKALAVQGARLGLVAIDYAELMGSDLRNVSREQELSAMAQGLKNLRDELGTTILLLSQTNKQGGERWSEGIGNAADVIINWTITDEDSNGSGAADLWIEKNRLGPEGKWRCSYDYTTSRIWEQTPDYSDPSYPPIRPWWMGDDD